MRRKSVPISTMTANEVGDELRAVNKELAELDIRRSWLEERKKVLVACTRDAILGFQGVLAEAEGLRAKPAPMAATAPAPVTDPREILIEDLPLTTWNKRRLKSKFTTLGNIADETKTSFRKKAGGRFGRANTNHVEVLLMEHGLSFSK